MSREEDYESFNEKYPDYPRYYEVHWSLEGLPKSVLKNLKDINLVKFGNFDDAKANWNDTDTALGWAYNRFIAKKGKDKVEVGYAFAKPDGSSHGGYKNIDPNNRFSKCVYVGTDYTDMRFGCYYKYLPSKQEQLLDLEIEFKRLQIQQLQQQLGVPTGL